MLKLPVHYDRARRELAAATRIDEVKAIRDKALAIEVYAYQCRDAELAGNAVRLKRHAVRRLGELMGELREAGKLAKPPGGSKARPRKDRGVKSPDHRPTLLDQGVDKDLAKAARRAKNAPADKYERETAKACAIAAAHALNNQAVIRQARAERHQVKRSQRQAREQKLANKLLALPKKKYAVILADPEWRFNFWSEKGKTNSSADNHYDTSELEAIKQRDVASIAADDCVLWLWATVPMLPQALEVMAAWGFSYKSSAVWVKNKAGTGYWFRNKHELLLVGVRGKIPAPADGDQWESAIAAAVGKHSTKPEKFLELIEAYFPNVPKIELNRRGAPRKGWDAWGLEVQLLEAAE